jgi:uncharacterized glyoxalase superfamily protein PhnB
VSLASGPASAASTTSSPIHGQVWADSVEKLTFFYLTEYSVKFGPYSGRSNMLAHVNIRKTSRSPITCLDAASGDQYVSFILVAFDAEILDETRYLDHQVKSITLQIGDGTIEFADRLGGPSNPAHINIVTNEVVEVFERAVSFGATECMAPRAKVNGGQQAGVVDFYDNVWWIDAN